ncbi:MAG: complex I subunit 1 family protein [candidate division WOR-3 bacterium]
MKLLFYYLIFPGFVFSSFIGLIISWLDRKISARIQWREGPPWFQGFADIGKLLYKEVIIPKEASSLGFVLGPLFALASVCLGVTILLTGYFKLSEGFIGDIIVVWYLFTIPSIAIIYIGSLSGNPLSSVGVSREIKLLLSYELPMVILIVMITSKVRGFSIKSIMDWQIINGPNLFNWYGIIGFIVSVICIQAKLGRVPFDLPEAETELGSGILLELSGSLLALYELSKAIMLFGLPMFLVILFWGRGILGGILLYLLIVFLLILIKNTNPRLRIDQVMRYFWGWLTGASILAGILAYLGV